MQIGTYQKTLIAVGVLAGVIAIGLAIFAFLQHQELTSRASTITDLEATRTELVAELDNASTTRVALEEELNSLKDEFGILTTDYESERDRNEDFEDQIGSITKTVGVLDKLSKTDKELLQKYSRVYFLNEHYVPESLREIENEWKYNEAKELKLHSKARPFFDEMLEDAKEDGIELWVVSAYRSFAEQAALKGRYLVTYGSGSNTFSADQGFSEHQLGTTVDFTTRGLSGGLSGFENTAAYQWLLDNAHKYGFTLSYPQGNAYYEYEPWHWRFVGEDLAEDLHKANAHFYDWEQRKIDAYLVSIFD